MLILMQNQLDHINTTAQPGPNFVPGGAFRNGNPFVMEPSGKVLPRSAGSMVDYYPPFTQNSNPPSDQAVPLSRTVLPMKPITSTSKPTPGGLYPVQEFQTF